MEANTKSENISNFREVIVENQKYQNILFDCDGVLWNGYKPITGAFNVLYDCIINKGKQVFLVTNNAIYSRE